MRTLVLTVAILTAAPIASTAQTISLTPAQTNATVGDTVRFRAVVRDARGAVLDTARVIWAASPFDAVWAAQDGRIVPMRQSEIQVLAIHGTTTARAVITVAPKPPARIDLSSPYPTVVVGGLMALNAVARTDDNETLRDARVLYRSSNEQVATVDAGGVVTARRAGAVTITASTGRAQSPLELRVVPNRVARIEIDGAPTARTGDVVRFNARLFDAAGAAVSGLPVQWTVSGAGADVHPDGGFVAENAGPYTVSAVVGQVSASRPISVTPRVHNRRLERVSAHIMGDIQAAEHWAINDVLYVSTIADRLYTFDIRNPLAPVLADSIMVDARVINDVQTTPDGKIGVLTREGASTRRNGIVFLDLNSPLHPKIISEYTSTVTGGVHSVYVDSHYVYLTDDATGSMRIIDFADLRNPREVGRWEISGVQGKSGDRDPTGQVIGGSVGRMLHDIQIKDGLAYLAYWRHGVIILDVGNGIKGGTPAAPKLVSQFTYNVTDLYPADRIAGTHSIFRYKNYLFVADEVFPGTFDLQNRARIETMGQLHVLDVSDVERPKKVAFYHGPGGAHNFWLEDDVLYLGAFEAGLRALDVSGELRGDLVRQGREIGSVWTGDPKGFRPNLPMAWGAQPHKGVIYLTDINSGLWVARLVPKITM